MQAVSFEEALGKILERDLRFHREAYYFVREALDQTQKLFLKKKQPRHVSGQELLEGIRCYGLEQYGPMTLTVFHEWGVRRCEDFGEIVFKMVEFSLLAKTDKDSHEDFKGGYDFYEAFQSPFLPSKPISKLEPEPKSTQV